ncbi:SMP-30/gluconolactonase/LRE family protein [Isoptericola sp. NPDC019482]|uniref:SMP-30/gluconolactonase/LRE family protein n=1 Tax=Isoptericola sp. NPDC019482 TaxID=3154688 RepID=UPI00349979A9
MTAAPDTPWRPLGPRPHELGEGLRRDGGTLRWVDLLRGELYAWDTRGTAPAAVTHRLDRPTGVVERAEDGTLVGAVGTGVAQVHPDGTHTVLADTGLDPARHRVNDGALAPDGSFWFGTMVHDGSAPDGAVWRWHPTTGAVTPVLQDIDVPNGPTFLPDAETVLVADSAAGRILRARVGSPEQVEDFVVVEGGSPDGMHVDHRGRVWSAVWGAARVDVYGTDGARLGAVRLPVRQPTSVVLTREPDPLVVVTSATLGLGDPGHLDGHTIAARLSRLRTEP